MSVAERSVGPAGGVQSAARALSPRSDRTDMEFDDIEQLVDAVRDGRMVIVVDDDAPACEGRLVMAAEHVRAEDVNFMARHARALICLALTRERCEQLQLPLMVQDGYLADADHFTVSIEAAQGVSTGISAADRARTIQAAVAPDARPTDLVQPGHVFPIVAQPGGVLTRAGHGEAACDLARLAGCRAAAVTVEILDADGELAGREALVRLAREHDLRIGSIAALIEYRIRHEKTIRRVAESGLPTEFGQFRLVLYQETVGDELHLAMVKGEVQAEQPVPVRVHIENPVCDLTGNLNADCGWPLRDVLQRLSADGGVAVILRNKVDRNELVRQVQRYAAGGGCEPADTPASDSVKPDLRVIGLGAQILVDLGVRRMRVLGMPRRFHGIGGFGLEVVEHVT